MKCFFCSKEYNKNIGNGSSYLYDQWVCPGCTPKELNNQPECSKREDLVRLEFCCPDCKFEWQQDMDMFDETDGISPCLNYGYN